jgi:hypothetical protein
MIAPGCGGLPIFQRVRTLAKGETLTTPALPNWAVMLDQLFAWQYPHSARLPFAPGTALL